jgi:hypothetical protein
MFLDYAELKNDIGHHFILESGNIAHQNALRYITALSIGINVVTPNREDIYRLLMESSHKDRTRLQDKDRTDMPLLREIAATVLATLLSKKYPTETSGT